MLTVNQQRDKLITMLADILFELATEYPSFTAQQFVDRARANARCGNHEQALTYLEHAKSYVLPEKVTL